MIEVALERALTAADTDFEHIDLHTPFCTVKLSYPRSEAYLLPGLNYDFSPLGIAGTVSGQTYLRVIVTTSDRFEPGWRSFVAGEESFYSSYKEHGAFPVRWWPTTPRRCVWVAEYVEANHVVLRRDGDICIVLNHCDAASFRYVQRLLREILIHIGHKRGFLLFHASALGRPDGSAVAILGCSGAGKTDLAVRLSRQGNASLISADRVLIGRCGADSLCIVGLPFGLNIHRRTLAAIGVEPTIAAAAGSLQDEKIYLDRNDFCVLSGISMVSDAVLARLAILSDRDMTPLSVALLMCELERHLLTGRDPGYTIDWVGLNPEPASRTRELLGNWPLLQLCKDSAMYHRPPGAEPPEELLAWIGKT